MTDPFFKVRTSKLLQTIVPYRPEIAQRDLDRGIIWRYFVSRSHLVKSEVVEVSSSYFSLYDFNPTIIGITVRWVIRGKLDDSVLMVYTGRRDDVPDRVIIPGVRTQNRASIEEAAETIPALRHAITPTQYYFGE